MVTAKRHPWGVQTISAVCFCGGGLVLTDWLSEGQKLFGFTLAVFPSESDVCRPAWALWRYFFYRRAVMRLNWAIGPMTDAPRLHFNQSSSVIHAALTLAQLFYCQRSFGQKSPKSNKKCFTVLDLFPSTRLCTLVPTRWSLNLTSYRSPQCAWEHETIQ